MRKFGYLLGGTLCFALIMASVLLFAPLTVANAAVSNVEKSYVVVSGEDISENYTYYLEWSNTSFTYDGKNHRPSAVLKCEDDATFAKEMTVEVYENGHLLSQIFNAGNYTAVAVCQGVTFTEEGGNRNSFSISPLRVAVDWNKAAEYTYNGAAQYPTASFTDVEGNKKPLTVYGAETNVGNYTAYVAPDAAGGNYTLTNLTCEFTIAKLATKVLWVESDYYVANGKTQGPKAFCVAVDGEVIEIPVICNGVEAGEYVATVDPNNIYDNYDFTADFSYKYRILPEKQFGEGGFILSLILGLLLLIALACVLYSVFLRKNDVNELNKLKDDDVELKNENAYLNAIIDAERKDSTNEINRLNQRIAELENSLADLETQLADAEQKIKKRSQANSENKKAFAELQSEFDRLNEDYEKLKKAKPYAFTHPIEDYFPEIDAAFDYADSCEYDKDDPSGSFAIQRQQLNTIKKWLAAYRSQRR